MPKRFLYVDLETGELDPAVRHRRVDVDNAAARLALTAATVSNGDYVREVGQQEIVEMTCVGNIYGSVPAVAEVQTAQFPADSSGSLTGTDFYIYNPTTYCYDVFWFQEGGSTNPFSWGPESANSGGNPSSGGNAGIHYIPITVESGDNAATVAGKAQAVLDANCAGFLATALADSTLTLTWTTAGALYDTCNDDGSGTSFTEITAGADSYVTNSLHGKTMTLQAATVAVASTDTPRISFARVLGFSTDGSVGDLPITLLNENLTAQQVAGLVAAAIAADGRFTTSVSGANVTVTCAANGAVNAVTGAGNTGFAVTRLQAGITGALTYELIDAGQISSAAGWNELPCLVGFYATARPSAQTVSNNTARNLLTATQAPQGSKVVVNTPYGAYIVVNAGLLSPNGSTPGSAAAFGPNLLAPFYAESVIGYDYAWWDTHFQFDPQTHAFHCKVPGKYAISVQLDLAPTSSASNTRALLQLRKNGALATRLVDVTTSAYQASADLNLNCSLLVVELATGDVVTLTGFWAGNGAIAYMDSPARSFLQAHRVGP